MAKLFESGIENLAFKFHENRATNTSTPSPSNYAG